MSSSRIKFQLRSLLRHAVPYWIYVCIFFFAAFFTLLMTLRHQEQDKARQKHMTRKFQESMDNVAYDLQTPIIRLRSIAK